MSFFRSIRSLFLLGMFLVSIVAGISLSSLLNSPASAQSAPIPNRYQIGQQTYLENCSSCHIPIAAAVLPTQTWKNIMENPNFHYGVRLQNMIGITQRLIWDYLSYASRPIQADAPVPLFAEQSTFFKALHPRVTLPKPTTHTTCAICHPNAARYDYRTLTPAWDDAP